MRGRMIASSNDWKITRRIFPIFGIFRQLIEGMMKRIVCFLAIGWMWLVSAFAQQEPPAGGPRVPPEQLLQQFDRNGDGKIGRDEAPERMIQRWDQVDSDRSGFVTLEELKARDARVAGMENRGARFSPPQSVNKPAEATVAKPGTHAFVNAANVSGGHDGRTWASAFASLQDALASGAVEIWVAKGVYSPGADRDATFQLLKGGALFGGFVGNEAQRDQRDWLKNRTVLNGNGASHVVTGADDAVLDGFTVTGGKSAGGMGGPPGGGGGFPGGPRAGGFPPGGGAGGPAIHVTPQMVMSGANAGSGGGMLNFHASPTVRNCIFENNQAGKGGAVYNMTSTSFPPRPDANSKAPVFINCIFRKNSARGRGAGVANDLGTSPTFLNCVFEANATPQKGGGMYNDFGCSPTLINCLFTGNDAQSAGGMGNDGGSSPVLYFCTFTKNHAADYGAPLYQGTGPASNPSLINCLVADNACDWDDPGIYNWHDCSPLIKDGADSGYKPGRFTEGQLAQLLDDIKPYRAQPVREEIGAAPERIPSSSRVIQVGGDAAALQAALEDAAKDGAEVRVAPGTYKLSGKRNDAFVLRPGVRVYGGGKAVLDGHRAYHVVVGANGAQLDGFTITGGHADGAGYDGKGGGLINYRRGPQGRPNSENVMGFAMTINRCVFTNNFARDGGAVYSFDRAKPVFSACLFVDNRADNGGAVLDRVGVEAKFENCEFIGNASKWRGGAVYFDYGSRPRLSGCTFRGNTTGGHGGAVFSVSRASQLENTVVTLADCQFETNTAKGRGGAAAFCDNSISVAQNCRFAGNKAGLEGDDSYVDSSSSTSSTAMAYSSAADDRASDTSGRRGGNREMGLGGRPGAPMGGEMLPTQFQPHAEFSVVIIGSGSPQHDPKRAGPSAMIQYRGQYFLVDAGNGTQARLYELGVSLRDIPAILLTHHHLDHTEEFIPLLVYRLLRGRDVDVIGPPGTEKCVGFARDFYAEDMAYRMSRRGRAIEDAGKPVVREVKGGERFDLGGMKIATAKVNHTIHTVAYRFDADGKSIVISGDTTYSDGLIELSRDADVLVLDSGASIVRQGAERRSDGAGQHNEAHASLQEICNMVRNAHAKKVVLTHIAPGDVDEAATIRALGESCKAEVIVGRDLLEIVP